jgi:hypothetical protein
MKFSFKSFLVGFGCAALSLGAVSFANASSGATMKACANKVTGVMRYISEGSCKKTETSLSWNKKGPAGSPGNSGATGLTGTKGDTGLTGTKGDTGLTGTKGDTGLTGTKGDTGLTGSPGLLDNPMYGIRSIASDAREATVLASSVGIDGLPLMIYQNLNGTASFIKCQQIDCSQHTNMNFPEVDVSWSQNWGAISFSNTGNPILFVNGDGHNWAIFCSAFDCSSYTTTRTMRLGYPATLPNGKLIIFAGSYASLCTNAECSTWSEVSVDTSDGVKENPGVIIDRVGRPVFAHTHRICCDGSGNATYTLKISRCSDSTCQTIEQLYDQPVLMVSGERVRVGLSPQGLIQVVFTDRPILGSGLRRVHLISCESINCLTTTTSVIASSSSFPFRYIDANRNRLNGYWNVAYIDDDSTNQTLWFKSCSSTTCIDQSTSIGTGYKGVSTGIGVDGLPFLFSTVGNSVRFIRCSSQDCAPYSR